jgi:hypothetical protein
MMHSDARPVNDALSLDREGFVLVHHQTAATDLYDQKKTGSSVICVGDRRTSECRKHA